MSDKIQFIPDVRKAIETIVWLASNKPGIDIYHVAKVMYYADKMHLNRYGRPIVGDKYIKMKNGPAPSLILDVINGNSFRFSREELECIESSISVSGRYKNSEPLRAPELSYFSESDLECLSESLGKNGDKTFDELFNSTHEEASYNSVKLSDTMDYALMVDEDNPHAEEIRTLISSESAYIGM